jgi:hypothetical protein
VVVVAESGHEDHRRISSGLEVYSSIDASADGRRLVATISNPTANLASLPILDRVTTDDDVKPLGLPTVRAMAPRYGGSTLFYSVVARRRRRTLAL